MKIELEKILIEIKNYTINFFGLLSKKESSSLKSILEDHVDHRREFSASEKNMLINIVGFGESRVEDSMVPRADIIAVDIKTPPEEIIKLFSECNHSRIALYRSTLDDPIGMLHIKDFVGALSQMKIGDIKIKTLVKDILFVPPSMKSRELLLKMQASRIHMALVVDEYGGTDGLLTIENLIEEIVGEIEDEHDAEDLDEEIIKKEDNLLIVDAAYRIDELEKDFNINLVVADEEEIETVGGLVFSKINRIPKSNEEFNLSLIHI